MKIDPAADELKRLYEKNTHAREKFDAFQRTSAAERSQFFERLALMNGAAIVLSVTFLGYFLSNHATLRYRHLLHSSWGLLLLSLLACLLRNLFYQNYLYYVTATPYVHGLAERAEMEARVALDPSAIMVDETGTRLAPSGERAKFASDLQKTAEMRRTEADHAKGKGERAEKIWKPCEPFALWSVFLGITLLVIFAVLNT